MKAMFIGTVSAGKTTLIQKLCEAELKYDKTQAVEYVDEFIDTPGEYMQVRAFWCSLTVTSYDADIICLVQDSTSEDCWFSGGIRTKFAKPVLGIVTKIDRENANVVLAREYLEYAGCDKVLCVSALEGIGIQELKVGMENLVQEYYDSWRNRYTANYYD